MFRKFNIVLILLTVTSFTFAQKNCERVKTGKFKLVNQELGKSHLIERNDSIQREMDMATGSISSFSVLWKSNCEYELRLIETNDPNAAGAAELVLVVNILKVTRKGYQFKAKAIGVDFEIKFEVTRVK